MTKSQMRKTEHQSFCFEEFTLDLTRGCLFGPKGEEIRLRPKSFEVLRHLVENCGRLVSKEELIARVWTDTAVTDDSVVQCLIDVRRALCDTVQRIIKTVPRRGYIFEPEVIAKDTSRTNSVAATVIHSIAVLPLQNLSDDPGQEYFADGVTEALISSMSQIGGLRVISRTSIMRYKTSDKSLPDIARELHVDALIEGSVKKSGGRVLVTVKLVPAATDAPSWAREYEREALDILKLEREIARAVAHEIRVQVAAGENARLLSARSIHADAHEAFLLGKHHLSRGDDQSLKQAISYFQRATEIAPDYAAPFAALSEAWTQLGIAEARYKEVEPQARAAALKAIEFDDLLPEARIALANIKASYDWDWQGSEQEFERALSLDPNNVEAHLYYGHLLTFLGRHTEGIWEGEIAVQLDPLSAAAHSALGWFLHFDQRDEQSLMRLKRAVELEPRNILAKIRMAKVCAQLSRYDEAIALFESISALAPGVGDYAKAGIARVYASMGRQQEALQLIRAVAVRGYVIAVVYAALNDKDAAFSTLETAINDRGEYLHAMKCDPAFENLHSDPRWDALLGRMNLLG
jgi:TolB-like protein/Tfp pilus assembly protein PilF